MSSMGLNVSSPDDVDYHSDHEYQRRRLALANIHPEDLLAATLDSLAEQPLAESPLRPLILFLLDRAWTPGDGGVLFDGLKAAVTAQVERLLDATLADPSAWED